MCGKWIILWGIGMLAGISQAGAQSAPVKEAAANKKGLSYKKGSGTILLEAERDIASDNELQQARGYIRLADALMQQGQYARAEAYYGKAIALYKKQDQKSEWAAAQRKLAKTQELQEKRKQAARNYDLAAQESGTNLSRQLNTNDANRLRTSNAAYQRKMSQENVSLLQNAQNPDLDVPQEMSDAYTRLAVSEQKTEDNQAAIQAMTQAVLQEDRPSAGVEAAAAQLSRELSRKDQLKEAISLNKKLVDHTDARTRPNLKVTAYTQLGDLYARSGNDTLAEENLRKAYDTARSVYNLQSGRLALQQLLTFYYQEGQYAKAETLTTRFLNDMDIWLQQDSSLMDRKAFEQSTQRIRQLETEKALQKAVIQQSRRANYLLLAIIAGAGLFLIFLFRAYNAIRRKNKQIRLQSLRREMNPHFVFNSLNSVNQFIAENDDRKANAYLNAYSRLMRTVMEHSSQDFVPLSVELDHLQKYLSLEYQRFSSQFTYEITVDPDLDIHDIQIPNMIIQPFLENAIWHGLRYKRSPGHLQLYISRKGAELHLTVKDDGIGIAQSQALKTSHQKAYRSLGMQNTRERISLLNSLYKSDIRLQVTDLTGSGGQGTEVHLCLPIQKKQDEDTDH